MPAPTPVALWEFIKSTYNLEELESLCFQLGVHFDDLEGETREAKARELVEHLQRTDRLDELMAILSEERSERYLSAFGESPDSSTVQPPVPETNSPSRIDRRIIWVIGALALLALIIWIVSAWRGRAGTRPEPSTTTAVTSDSDPVNPTSDEIESKEDIVAGMDATPVTAQTLTPSIVAMTMGEVITRTVTTPAGTSIEQVFVPAGSFRMGMDMPDHYGPIHKVSLDPFWLDKTEVTNQQYEACVMAGACQPPEIKNSLTRSSYHGNTEYDDYPVIAVSWSDALTYCEWAGGRLPTEAEWEYAARGPENFIYPWGNEDPSCDRSNYGHECVGDTSKGGSNPSGASWIGALDMAGNVQEWVNDWFDINYYQISPEKNPPGPSSSNFRVIRGGYFGSNGIGIDTRYRYFYSDSPSSTTGFRCAGG